MSEYSYLAIDPKGKEVEGEIRAHSKEDAAFSLVHAGFFVHKISEKEQKLFTRSLFLQKDSKYLAIFFRQLAILVNGGISLHTGLKIISKEVVPKSYRDVLLDLSHLVETGIPLSKALEKYPSHFGSEIFALVYAGEVSGTLDIILERVATHLEKMHRIHEKTLTILLYPLILLLTAFCVIIFVLSYVLPTFQSLFSSLHTILPLPTKVLLFLSEAWGDLSLASILLTFLLLLIFFLFVLYFPYGERVKIFFSSSILRFPILGKLLRYTEIMQVTWLLSLLLKSGIVIDKALCIVQKTVQNRYIASLFQKVTLEVQKGFPLSKVLGGQFFLDPLFLMLLKVGEKTGELDFALDKIATFATLEVDTLTKRLEVVLEPLLILVLGAIIGFIVLAIALPILNSVQIFM